MKLQWLSLHFYDWAMVFQTDTNFKHSHFSDHVAIITKRELLANSLLKITPCTRPNLIKTDWEKYQCSLSSLLPPALHLLAADPSGEKVNTIATSITSDIHQAIKSSTTFLRNSQHSRSWWCTLTLNLLKGHSMDLQRRSPGSGAPVKRMYAKQLSKNTRSHARTQRSNTGKNTSPKSHQR